MKVERLATPIHVKKVTLEKEERGLATIVIDGICSLSMRRAAEARLAEKSKIALTISRREWPMKRTWRKSWGNRIQLDSYLIGLDVEMPPSGRGFLSVQFLGTGAPRAIKVAG